MRGILNPILNHRLTVWLLLSLPAFGILLSGAPVAERLHPTGEWSARLLILALAVTPLTLVANGAAWTRWLAARRRYIGVAAFGYAALHLVYYLVDMGALEAVLAEVPIASIWTAWAAFFAMLVMAAISNDASMRWLRAGWKRLQRLAYPAALLTLAHWLLVHDGVTEALLHFAPLALLELYRIIVTFNQRKPEHA